jgi:hypothetical protein
MFESVLSYTWTAIRASLLQIGIFFVPGLLLTLVMNLVSSVMQRRALLTMGKGWYLGLFGWLGTTVHELGHAVFCLIFRHKITAIKLFEPDPQTGTLGYVEHTYEPTSLYQQAGNFFIGIGPVLLGTSLIFVLMYFLLGINPFTFTASANITTTSIYSWEALGQLVQIFWNSSGNLLYQIFSTQNISTWQFYLFLYLAFAIGSFISLSPADLKGSFKGFGIIVILIFIFNLATVWAGDLTTNLFWGTFNYFMIFYVSMFLILLLVIFLSVLILLPLSLLKKRSGSN